MADVFISYSREDLDVARAIEAGLRSERIDAWRDESRLTGGQEFGAEIQSALERAKCVLACLSPSSIGSKWVRAEMRAAGDRLLPCVIERFQNTVEIDALAGSLHQRDLTRWVEAGDAETWKSLVRDIAGKMAQPRAAAPPAPRPAKTADPGKARDGQITSQIVNTGSAGNIIGVSLGGVRISPSGDGDE
jgi:hypothetical protein